MHVNNGRLVLYFYAGKVAHFSFTYEKVNKIDSLQPSHSTGLKVNKIDSLKPSGCNGHKNIK